MRRSIALFTTAVLAIAGITATSAQTTTTIGPCMQSAIETRDSNLMAQFDAYHANAKNALQSRKDNLKTAWNIADKDQRKLALKNTWKIYKAGLKAARQSFKDGRKSTWRQFKADAKVCGARGAEASDGQSTDNSL